MTPSNIVFEDPTALAVLRVDLDAINSNWRLLAKRLQPTRVAAVVKANAYGLGAVAIAPALAATGCQEFFVFSLDEALALRPILDQAGFKNCTVAVLTDLPPSTFDLCIEDRITPVCNDPTTVQAWLDYSAHKGRTLPAMLHLDTGMNRLGMTVSDFDRLSDDSIFLTYPWQMLLSHLACSDKPENPLNETQCNIFASRRSLLPHVPASLSASGGAFLDTRFHFDIVRLGGALYGLNPQASKAGSSYSLFPGLLQPVSLYARILQIRVLDKDDTVGYGGTSVLPAGSRVGTAALGYADGYLYSAGRKGYLYYRNQPVPVVGRISMDLVTFDVTACPQDLAGDWVEILGPNRSPDAFAILAGTVGQEVLACLGSRFRRVYITGGTGA